MKNLSKLVTSVFLGSMILACIGCYIGPPHVTSIEIISEPTKTEYFVGDKLDITGLKVVAHLSNRGTRILFGDNYPHESYGEEIIYDFSTPNDNAEVRIIYDEMEVSFTVKVIEPTLLNIEISRPAKKTEYYVGDKLDITGLKITAFFDNGEKNYDYFSFGKKFIFEFDSSIAGDNIPVKIKFLDKELSYTVRVIPVEVEKIKITKPAKRTYYCIGQELDTTGLEISAIYNNGTIAKVITDYQILFDNSQEGYNIPVTIKYNEFVTDYTVSVYNHNFLNHISCSRCGIKKTEFRNYDFLYITEDLKDIKYITADSSELGITINEDKETVNIYGIKIESQQGSILPDSIITADLTGIDFSNLDKESSGIFKNCSNLISVTIPNSLTYIVRDAFKGCTSLTSVTIPNSVTSIDYYAFEDCINLTAVHITDINKWVQIAFSNYKSNPLTYAKHLYVNGTKIEELVLNNEVTSIGNSAFSGCTSLTSITIPNSVTSIGRGAFDDCTSLTSVTIPNSVTSIGDSAFKGCTSLTSVTISNSVTSIEDDTFYSCTSLTSVTIPNSVTSIGYNAFRECSNLTSVIIPETVTFIGSFAFYCDGLLPNGDSKAIIYYNGRATGAPWCAKEVLHY